MDLKYGLLYRLHRTKQRSVAWEYQRTTQSRSASSWTATPWALSISQLLQRIGDMSTMCSLKIKMFSSTTGDSLCRPHLQDLSHGKCQQHPPPLRCQLRRWRRMTSRRRAQWRGSNPINTSTSCSMVSRAGIVDNIYSNLDFCPVRGGGIPTVRDKHRSQLVSSLSQVHILQALIAVTRSMWLLIRWSFTIYLILKYVLDCDQC